MGVLSNDDACSPEAQHEMTPKKKNERTGDLPALVDEGGGQRICHRPDTTTQTKWETSTRWLVGCDDERPIGVSAAMLADFSCQLSMHIVHETPEICHSTGRLVYHQRCTRACLLSMIQSMRYGRLIVVAGADYTEVCEEMRFQGISIADADGSPLEWNAISGASQQRHIALPSCSGLVDCSSKQRHESLLRWCDAVAYALVNWPKLAHAANRSLSGADNLFSCNATSAWVQFVRRPLGRPTSTDTIENIAIFARRWPTWIQNYMTLIASLGFVSALGGLERSSDDVEGRHNQSLGGESSAVDADGTDPKSTVFMENPLKSVETYGTVTSFLSSSRALTLWHVALDCSRHGNSFRLYSAWFARYSAKYPLFAPRVVRWVNELRRVASGLDVSPLFGATGATGDDKWAECYVRFCLEQMESTPSLNSLFSSECSAPGILSFERRQLATSLGTAGVTVLEWADTPETQPSNPAHFPPGWSDVPSPIDPPVEHKTYMLIGFGMTPSTPSTPPIVS